MKKILIILLTLFSIMPAYAGTPAEEFIKLYSDAKGVQIVEAEGFLMKFARGAIRKTPMKPLAEQVNAVTVCKLQKVPQNFVDSFVPKLRETLKQYDYYGIKPGEEARPVEVYGSKPVGNVVKEIVVFNPDLNHLFSLRGEYQVEELKRLDK